VLGEVTLGKLLIRLVIHCYLPWSFTLRPVSQSDVLMIYLHILLARLYIVQILLDTFKCFNALLKLTILTQLDTVKSNKNAYIAL